MALNTWPLLGCGVGLRTQHYAFVTEERPKMDWFEAVTENFMDSGGRPIRILEEVRKHYPVALHGVSLSVGSADPLDKQYLERLYLIGHRLSERKALEQIHAPDDPVDRELNFHLQLFLQNLLPNYHSAIKLQALVYDKIMEPLRHLQSIV